MILNKVYRTPKSKKKFVVFVENKKGKIIKVEFGDNNYRIKRNYLKNKIAYLKRHNCSNAGSKLKPNYWSCLNWKKKLV
mgnify:CR=1 FL=1